jgi:PmbA protein
MDVKQQLSEIQNVVHDVLTMAKSLGATGAEASISKVQGISVGTRLKEIETVEFNNDGGLGITVYNGQRKGSASTADLSKQALQATVSKAVEISKYTGEDACSGVADAELMATDIPDLGLYYPQELDTEKAIADALLAESTALDQDQRISNSDGASFNGNIGVRVYGNSHGFNAGYASSRYSLSCVLIAEQNGDMQRDYHYTVSRDGSQLESPETVGLKAVETTIARLGAEKLSTQKVPVVFHREIASSLFSHFVSAISGGSLYRKSSFLLDSLGSQVLAPNMNIVERPHILGGLASSPFDHEGVATQDMQIVKDGVLEHYLLTSYSARKLGMTTNGHAGGIHNWQIADHGMGFDELLRKMGTGLLVTELMGHGVNIVTGDYSRGAAGFWVENGIIQYPVHEITIAGNLTDMYQNIVAVGNDIEARGAVHTGSILISEMQIAGQ